MPAFDAKTLLAGREDIRKPCIRRNTVLFFGVNDERVAAMSKVIEVQFGAKKQKSMKAVQYTPTSMVLNCKLTSRNSQASISYARRQPPARSTW